MLVSLICITCFFMSLCHHMSLCHCLYLSSCYYMFANDTNDVNKNDTTPHIDIYNETSTHKTTSKTPHNPNKSTLKESSWGFFGFLKGFLKVSHLYNLRRCVVVSVVFRFWLGGVDVGVVGGFANNDRYKQTTTQTSTQMTYNTSAYNDKQHK